MVGAAVALVGVCCCFVTCGRSCCCVGRKYGAAVSLLVEVAAVALLLDAGIVGVSASLPLKLTHKSYQSRFPTISVARA